MICMTWWKWLTKDHTINYVEGTVDNKNEAEKVKIMEKFQM